MRILPLLGVVLMLLTVLGLMRVPGFAPENGEQSVAGLLGSALTFTFNWYEGRTGWAPAGWDVLWSLSIEEVFYLGFPLLCLWLPRRLLVGLLLAWALCLLPLRALVLANNEVWWEKAYLPGMAAIGWGVLTAMLARRWRPGRRDLRALGLFGAFCIVFVLGWSDLVHRHLFKSGLYGLCLGTCFLLFAFHGDPPTPRLPLRWLARMGSLSYELYLSHMFIVLATVALHKALLDTKTWNFVVYLPVLLCCYAVARRLESATARLGLQRVTASTQASGQLQREDEAARDREIRRTLVRMSDLTPVSGCAPGTQKPAGPGSGGFFYHGYFPATAQAAANAAVKPALSGQQPDGSCDERPCSCG